MRFATRAIRVGQQPDAANGAIVPPVYQTVNFVFKSVGEMPAYDYSRSGNPTRAALQEALASLEEAAHGLAFASGMAAADAVASLLRPGDHVVASRYVYGGTQRLFDTVLAQRGIAVTYTAGSDTDDFAAAVEPHTKMVWIETPANPLLQLVDVKAVAAVAHQAGAKLVADNTFASPFFQRPLTQGADIVLHSTTKYVSGHSDVIGGAVLTNDAQTQEQLAFYQNTVGAVPGPWDCWLSLRGLKTLSLRMRQHAANAQAVAEFLASQPQVRRVYYPGLPDHPQHELAKAQMDGFGGMASFELDGDVEAVGRFVKPLRIFLFGESLGGVESLAAHPTTMSHATVTPEQRAQAGITDGTIRLSVGIEDIEDLLEDLERGLKAV